LTIDDSSTIRSIITKQMADLGFEVDHAEDGQQGLDKLEDTAVDLILLDVTMPVMDGPTMLAALRERGDHTPVIMLTSESKRSIVSGAVKLGIEDYILKPFKPDELRAKVMKALKLDGGGGTGAGPIGANPAVASSEPGAAAAPAGSATRQFTDVLVVDDMENVHKKLRGLLPAHVSMNACVSAREALQMCTDRVYRVVVIDLVIPDVNSVALMNQLRALQPHAVMVALALRSAGEGSADVKSQGFTDVVYKPFEPAAVEDFLAKHFEVDDVLSIDGNVLACAAFSGKEDKLDRYFTRLRTLCHESLEKLASACHDDTILDLSAVPLRNDKIVRLLMDSDKEAKKLGIVLRLVGTPEIKKVLGAVMETSTMPFYASRADAQSGS
jgi:DNA-binding response OmpR family regulator/anti-anti-sigma regulatory factor